MPRTHPTPTPFTDFRLDFSPLAKHRRALGMSQQSLGLAVGIHKGTIWRTEHNKSQPSYAQMVAISKALGKPIYLLVTVVEEQRA